MSKFNFDMADLSIAGSGRIVAMTVNDDRVNLCSRDQYGATVIRYTAEVWIDEYGNAWRALEVRRENDSRVLHVDMQASISSRQALDSAVSFVSESTMGRTSK